MEKLNVWLSKELGVQGKEISRQLAGCDIQDLIAFSNDDWDSVLQVKGLSLGQKITYQKKIKSKLNEIAEDTNPIRDIPKGNKPDPTRNNYHQNPQPVRKEPESSAEVTSGSWSNKHLEEYKAAGIIPISPIHGILQVLVPIENRFCEGVRIHIFGGQKDESEAPERCAVREFHEETGKQLGKRQLKRLLSNSIKYYFQGGKFCLFVAVVYGQTFTQLPQHYRYNFHAGAEASSLAWIPLHTFMTSRKATINGETIFMSQMVSRITSCPVFQSACVEAMDILMKNFYQTQTKIVKRDYEALQSDKALITALKRSNGSLSAVDFPIPPPNAEVSVLAKDSEEFNEIMKLIPSEFHEEVRFIRKASVRARMAIWNAKRSANQSQEIYPVFYSTPCTWSGTCIAYQGFNLDSKLHWEAKGDGVFTTKSYSMAREYCAGKGSILCLRGQQGGNVEILGNDPILMYPDTDCVVVAYIIDIGPIDNKKVEKDESSLNGINTSRKEIEEAMEKKLGEFKTTLVTRTRSMNRVYSHYLLNQRPGERLLREAQQYADNLPIYSHKNDLIEKCINHQLVIVGGDTGCGKSTQLPQYLLDDVLNRTTQKVLVLQPSRINALKLAERVAFERGTELGEEVGWSAEGGCGVWTPICRILFMTHGFFLSWVLGNKELQGFGAILMDEAHEGSLEANLVFALIRQILHNNKEIRVVVSSATFHKDAENIRQFLTDNVNVKSLVNPYLSGTTFPVYTEYRQVVQPDMEKVSASGMGNIRLSVAVQAVVEILEHSIEGNILVFVPGQVESVSGKSQLESIVSSSIVNVFSLHEQTSPMEMEIIFLCESPAVIFATHMAETGLTFPNIRYVIDTGMDRTAQWDAGSGTTVPIQWISKSAADQRCGRAGRTASGYCLRLYSEEEYKTMSDIKPHSIQLPALREAVFSLYNYIRKFDLNYEAEMFPLPIKISHQVFIQSCEQLQNFGALKTLPEKATEFQLTTMGSTIADLGIGLRLGRFLIECCNRGVGGSGTTIAAMVILEAHRNMIKNEFKGRANHTLLHLYHDSGDYISFLQLYEKAQQGGNMERMLCPAFLRDMLRVRQCIHDRMTANRLRSLFEDNTDRRNLALEQALAIAYFDQICVAFGNAESVSRKFVRVMTPTIQRHCTAVQSSQAEDSNAISYVHASCDSTFFITRKYPNEDGKMVYGGEDHRDSNELPMVSWIMFISEDSYLTALQQQRCCNVVDIEKAMLLSKRATMEAPARSMAIQNEIMKRIEGKYSSAHVYIKKSDKALCVCEFEYDIAKIKNYMANYVTEQTILLARCPSENDFARICSFIRNKYETSGYIQGGKGSFGISDTVLRKSVTVSCTGDYKPLLPFICGELQRQLSLLQITTITTNNLSEDQEILKRYQQLINVVRTRHNKTSCMLQVARILLVDCNCEIFGRFVRDWLIRGEAENYTVEATTPSISQTLVTLHNSQTTHKFSLKVENRSSSTQRVVEQQVVVVTFENVEILVHLEESSNVEASVDASVNNLKLSEFSLQMKEDAEHSVATIVTNIKEKKFHFYGNWCSEPEKAKTRLESLLRDGYACLSGVPCNLHEIIDSDLHHLITFQAN